MDIRSAITTTGTLIVQGDVLNLASNISATGGTTLAGNTVELSTPITLGNNDIILGANTNVTSSSTNYFKTTGTGIVKRSIASGGSFIFPVGNTTYNPVTITNNTGSSDEFSVRVANDVLTSGTTGSPITDKVVNRTWHIGKTNVNANAGIDLSFQWEANQELGTLTDYKLSHYGSFWAPASGNSGAVSINGTTKTMTHTGYTGTFSPFSIGSTGSALPVSWLDFTAKSIGQTIELNWRTASERNTKDFQVQHSINALQWNSLGELPAAGNSNGIRSYRFVHEGSFKNSLQHYYRILQRDLDGKFSYSKVIKIDHSDALNEVELYPNPTSDVLHVQLKKSQEIRLMNLSGKIVWEGQLAAGHNEIIVSSYPAGTYFLQTGSGVYRVLLQ